MNATKSASCSPTTVTGSASTISPLALRQAIRSGKHRGTTTGYASGYLQGNLAILPASYADEFLKFCARNPKSCPLIGMSEPGSPFIPELGADLDIRTDVPGYRVFRGTEDFESATDLNAVWRDDLVTFVLGCSFSFEAAITRSGVPLRHMDANRNVPMYVTNIETTPAGRFHGPLVVSMRSFKPSDAIRAILYSDRYRLAHGAPVHIGDPAGIGISDLMKPDFGDEPVVGEGDIPVFWACGVTPQMAIRNVLPDLAITHEPGLMLVTDVLAEAAEFTLHTKTV
ncbi:putative hydro-lyase [Thalassospira alkalitolerans]|uniref:putative hydro-lyase n=1 Tax=Thalassospira alkalitolerans TaxID=1293890 RepID=UPI000A1E570B|nr:putative hydro-lyase [Thalassospira alkalitolerans]